MRKKVAVVILNWNGHKLLETYLPSVVEYSSHADVEIVIIDNCSTDDSLVFLEAHYPFIRIISLTENHGYAQGYNLGLKQIDAEYFILLNSDVEVTKDWINPLIGYLDMHTDVAAAQPKLLSVSDKHLFEYAGASGGFIDKYGYPFCRGRIFHALEADQGQYDTITKIFWASGACLCIRSRDFFEVGGFDASFFAHMEEIDMCWRLNARARRIVCIPQSVVYHLGGGTLHEESPRKTFLNFRNNLLMLYKNLPQAEVHRTINLRILLDFMAAIKYALSGKIINAKAVIKAHREFNKIKATYKGIREENLKRTIVSDKSNTIYQRSILFDFYLRGIRRFSDLIHIEK